MVAAGGWIDAAIDCRAFPSKSLWLRVISDVLCKLSLDTSAPTSRRNSVLGPAGSIGRMTRVGDLFGCYHRLIHEVALRCAMEDAWRSDLQQILQRLDEDCRKLPHSSSHLLRCELAAQIEHEALGLWDPDKRAVLIVALKHLESA